MKFRHVLLVAGLSAAASSSFASQLYHPSNAEEGVTMLPLHQTSGLTREAVRTNVMGAQRDGTLSWISRGFPGTYPLIQGPKLGNSREQVQAELRAWQKNPATPDGMRFIPGELGWVEAR